METQVETVVFNGNTYRRYPNSKRRQHRVYFQYHDKCDATPRYLHRDVWIFHNGPIPKKHEIHHVDGNPLNNAIENLMCVTHAEHRRLDAARGACRTPAVLANLDRIRPLASEWHGSEEGRAWHSENAKRAWANRKPVVLTCTVCKAEFECLATDAIYCSAKCCAKARRDSGIDNEDRKCAECGAVFNVNRYSKAKTCSRSCAGRARGRTLRRVQSDG